MVGIERIRLALVELMIWQGTLDPTENTLHAHDRDEKSIRLMLVLVYELVTAVIYVASKWEWKQEAEQR